MFLHTSQNYASNGLDIGFIGNTGRFHPMVVNLEMFYKRLNFQFRKGRKRLSATFTVHHPNVASVSDVKFFNSNNWTNN